MQRRLSMGVEPSARKEPQRREDDSQIWARLTSDGILRPAHGLTYLARSEIRFENWRHHEV